MEEPKPKEPTEEQLAEADALIQRANLAKIRGNKREAEELLEKATEVAPGSARVLAARAEFLVERRQPRKAAELYAEAMKAAPDDKAIANRHAELVLATSSYSDPDALIRQAERTESQASASASALFSFILPGLGQIVAGQVVKGIVMLVIWLAALIAFFSIPGASAVLGSLTGPSAVEANPIGWLFLGIAVMTWVVAVADRTAAAKAVPKRKAERPTVPDEGKGYDS